MENSKQTQSKSTTVEPEPDRLLTIIEVADHIALSKATVRRYVAAGILPPPVLQGPSNATGGQTQRWWRSEILAYLAGLKRGRIKS